MLNVTLMLIKKQDWQNRGGFPFPPQSRLRAWVQTAARQGTPGSTVEHIVQASGVSRPTFYRHFKGRHEVLDAVIGRVNDVLTGIVTRAARLSLSL